LTTEALAHETEVARRDLAAAENVIREIESLSKRLATAKQVLDAADVGARLDKLERQVAALYNTLATRLGLEAQQ
jgi:polyhydroxyalkanoate synthesis regulator phasin